MAALGDKILDKRIVERNMAKGIVSKQDYEQHIAALPDKEGAYERVGVESAESQEETAAAPAPAPPPAPAPILE
jgi:hypothetical protein